MPKTPFLEFIADRVALFDGGVGTELYNRGVYINRCFDEQNLSNAKLVRDVHDSFVAVGCDAIETNTFGANRYKLAAFGFAEQIAEINYKGAKLAREAAGDDVYVAGSIGPLGIRIEPWGPTSNEEAREAFREQAAALLDGGVDFFALETFEDLAEIRQAILAVRSLCNLPILASLAVNLAGELPFGTQPEIYAKRLDEWGADMIGLNRTGPRPMLTAIEKMRKVTGKPLAAMPDAGSPKEVDGRNMYLASKDYMQKYVRRFIRSGCQIVGGDCGVTPDFIKAMRDAMRADTPALSVGHFARMIEKQKSEPATAPNVRPISQGDKSRLAKKIATGEFVTAVEIVPPRGCDPTKMLDGAHELKAGGVDVINIPDGPRAAARMGAQACAALIEREVGIETVLHYCCRDRNLLGMMSDLLGLYALGLRNILIITGDPPKMGDMPHATGVFDVDSIGLTNIAHRLNHGFDPGGNPLKQPTGWFLGVGADPGAVEMDREVSRFEWKVKAGAEYAVTQPVFDVGQLENFLARIEHVRIPVVAGIWPLVSLRNAEFMNNEVPGVNVPEEIMQRMRKANEISDAAAREEGLKIAVEMVEQVKTKVQGIQVSAPLGRVKFALQVVAAAQG